MLRSFNRPSWDIGTVSAPWGDRPSIYGYIANHVREGRHFSGPDDHLPDESRVVEQAGLRWASGALDGAMGHHAGGGRDENSAARVFAALQALTDKATNDRATALYAELTNSPAIDHIDALLPMLTAGGGLPMDRVRAVARWLATEASDREPVKTAIAILGIASPGEDRDLLMTLGRHEEFSLYAAVALQHSDNDAETMLWELAKHVRGWGRIQIVERLATTDDEQIKAWLLRDGCRNDIMDEYTALMCARTGDLVGALRRESDEPLLKGAGAIIAALIRGGPAEGVESYADGPEAAERYLHHLRAREPGLEDLNVAVTIERYLDEERSRTGEFAADWRRRAATIRGHILAIKRRPDWDAKIRRGLSSDDREHFWHATQAARALGIDTWDVYFERVKNGEDDWYFVMQTDDASRVDRVVELAEARLPLDEIASGAADELGLGPKYSSHSALDFVLQDLRRFPGKGWRLIRAGLQSPVTRNRNMALRALAVWNRSAWPPEAELLLRRAVRGEPNEGTRRNLQKVLSGEPLET